MQRYKYRAKLKDACNYAVQNEYGGASSQAYRGPLACVLASTRLPSIAAACGCLCPSVSWPPCMCARVHAPALQLSSLWAPFVPPHYYWFHGIWLCMSSISLVLSERQSGKSTKGES